jgi:hypothetical protein
MRQEPLLVKKRKKNIVMPAKPQHGIPPSVQHRKQFICGHTAPQHPKSVTTSGEVLLS